MLKDLISENQSAFVQGKAISDNVLITHEVLYSLKNYAAKKRVSMAVKIDMSKANGCSGSCNAFLLSPIPSYWMEQQKVLSHLQEESSKETFFLPTYSLYVAKCYQVYAGKLKQMETYQAYELQREVQELTICFLRMIPCFSSRVNTPNCQVLWIFWESMKQPQVRGLIVKNLLSPSHPKPLQKQDKE